VDVWRKAQAMQGLVAQGELLLRAGLVQEAIVRYEQATLAFPEHIEPWLGLGGAYRTVMDNDNAVAAFERAHRIEPDNIQANLGLAGVLLRDPANGREAQRYVEIALQSLMNERTADQTDLGSAYVLMGMALEYQGDDLQALTWYQKALDPPVYPEGRICVRIARIYQRRHRYEEAKRAIDCALAATEEMVKSRNLRQALLDYQLILSVDPGNPTVIKELEKLSGQVEGEGQQK
jgi:tetratricopeptide (TPR) repeat protein